MKPNYYSIIPAKVRYSDIPASAKLLYGEITSLSNKEGYCWATNSYFCELYDVDTSTITRWISVLEEKGFINSKIDKLGGNKRKIWITEDRTTDTLPAKIRVATRKNASSSINTKNNKCISEEILSFKVVSDKEERKPRDKRAWVLREFLYELFKKEHGVVPIPSSKDYFSIVHALKYVTESDIKSIVEEELSRGKKKTISEMLSTRSLNIYLQNN